MFRVRNGQRIELTPEEEAATLEKWRINRERHEAKEQERLAKEAIKRSACEKISQTCSLTADEIDELFGLGL